MNNLPIDGFLVDQINTKFRDVSNEAIPLLSGHGNGETAMEVTRILEEAGKSDLLKVVFVGQYSAGKSTIISALTGNRNIKIDADIATDKTTDYPWNGILLTDTPGLWTERP